jgi:hypothetical protein
MFSRTLSIIADGFPGGGRRRQQRSQRGLAAQEDGQPLLDPTLQAEITALLADIATGTVVTAAAAASRWPGPFLRRITNLTEAGISSTGAMFPPTDRCDFKALTNSMVLASGMTSSGSVVWRGHCDPEC